MGDYPLPDYGPVDSVNRPVRTRMRGGVGAGGRKTPGYSIGSFIIVNFNEDVDLSDRNK